MPGPVASTQRPATVATLLGDPICATLTEFGPVVPYCCFNGKGSDPGAANPANHCHAPFPFPGAPYCPCRWPYLGWPRCIRTF